MDMWNRFKKSFWILFANFGPWPEDKPKNRAERRKEKWQKEHPFANVVKGVPWYQFWKDRSFYEGQYYKEIDRNK